VTTAATSRTRRAPSACKAASATVEEGGGPPVGSPPPPRTRRRVDASGVGAGCRAVRPPPPPFTPARACARPVPAGSTTGHRLTTAPAFTPPRPPNMAGNRAAAREATAARSRSGGGGAGGGAAPACPWPPSPSSAAADFSPAAASPGIRCGEGPPNVAEDPKAVSGRATTPPVAPPMQKRAGGGEEDGVDPTCSIKHTAAGAPTRLPALPRRTVSSRTVGISPPAPPTHTCRRWAHPSCEAA
jgi:hypothetical protein